MLTSSNFESDTRRASGHTQRADGHIRSGFTLIELLVVISIIALLAAILFPVFARVRENARRTSCQSNLKQIGLGMMQYSQDYDETMPRAWFTNLSGSGSNWYDSSLGELVTDGSGNPRVNYKWMDAIFPYVLSEQIFVCPSARIKSVGIAPGSTTYEVNTYRVRGGATPTGSGSKRYGSYTMNAVYYNSMTDNSFRVHSPAGVKIAMIARTASTVLATDGNGAPFFGPPSGSTQMTLVTTTDPSILRNPVADEQGYAASAVERHLEFSNVLFCDGHVKAKKLEEFSPVKSITWYPFQTHNVHTNLTIEDD